MQRKHDRNRKKTRQKFDQIIDAHKKIIQYFFENIQGIDNVRLRTVYFAAVVDCMNMLVKLGYIKI